MLIAWCVAALLAAAPPAPGEAAAVSTAAAQKDTGQPPKKAKKPKKPKAPKEPQEPGVEEPAPDEPAPDQQIVEDDGVEKRGATQVLWRQHPSIRFGNAVRVDFEAKFQEDVHGSYPGALQAGLARWELHRNRIGIKGNIYKKIEYEVEYELTEKELTDKDVELGYTPKSQWKDVNVNLTYVKNAQIQIGKFKVPFGLDELTGVTHNDFVYRSLGANYLAPARDVGAMVHGSFLKHGFSYAAGGFVHDGDNARSKKIEGGDQTLASRVTARPFQLAGVPTPGVLEFGTAFALTKLTDDSFRPNGLRGRTVLTQDSFYEPVYVKGQRQRFEADVDWTVGPASARAEYTRVSDGRLAQGIGDQDLPAALAHSWYVSGTWVVTGESKRRPLRAKEALFDGGVGAIEVAARVERIWFDSEAGQDAPFRNPRAETIFMEAEHALTLGVNWTLNRFAKIQGNVIREQVEDPDRNPVPNGAAFWSRVVRLQLLF